MLDWNQCAAVERVLGKVSGAWVFRNTRIPVKALFENLEDGARVEDFLQWFPGVTREQVERVLEHAGRSPESVGRKAPTGRPYDSPGWSEVSGSEHRVTLGHELSKRMAKP